MISEAAQKGDALALNAFDFTGKILGKAFADAAAYFSPEAFILFGGLAQSGDLLLKPLRASFEQNVINSLKGKVQILLSGLKEDEAAIIGAGTLAWHEFS